jgi:3-hydroxyisobutyrate dehydrogenase
MSAAMDVGWIGTGVMGRSMCGHLLDAGHRVTVFTRTREKAEGLVERGATWAGSPAAVAAASEATFSIVGYPSDGREVILGGDGVLAGARPGSVIVDMTTSDPTLAVEIAEAAAAKDVQSLDAPVSGGDVGARNGTLTVMVGGEQAALDRVQPLLDAMSGSVILQGGPGAGQHTKMVNQTLIASGMVGICEALLYGHRAGLDLERVLESVSAGAAGSWSLSNLAPRILRGDFAPGFAVDHFVKDMGIALDQAERMGLQLPGLALARRLYVELQEQGGGRDGTQALIRAVARLSDLDWDAIAA